MADPLHAAKSSVPYEGSGQGPAICVPRLPQARHLLKEGVQHLPSGSCPINAEGVHTCRWCSDEACSWL